VVATLARRLDLDARRCAEGIVEIANATMVRALRRVSVERGVDPRAMTLVAFGGAGPLFACRLADGLGTQRAVVPPHAGALSALGLAAAPPRIEATASLHRSAGDLPCTAVNEVFHPLERAALDQLPGASITRVAECRYPGQGYELDVVMGADGPATAAAFHRIHQERHGHANPTGAVEIVNVRLVATGEATDVRLGARPLPEMASPSPVRPARRARFESLAPGEMVDGPFTLDAPESTTRIEPGWRGTMHPTGALILTRESR
jgi:N-methylhydantoinase A